MKFNLKSIVLLLSIIASTNNKCINAMEEKDINTSSNLINENNNIIINNVNTNDSIISETSINDSLNKYLRIISNGNNINIHTIQKNMIYL